MPTTTDFELIFLGNFADVDIFEFGDGSVAENAADLLGTYGSDAAPLWQQQFSVFSTDFNDDGQIDEDGEFSSWVDTFTVDVNGTPTTYVIDSTIGYAATVTYEDGTTESGFLGVLQDNAGNVWILPVDAGGLPSLNTKAIESLTLDSVSQDNGIGLLASQVANQEFVCFSAGTLIETPDGPRVIESLKQGDWVTTLDNGAQQVLWHGAREVDFRAATTSKHKPITFKPDALGPGQPKRPLAVSPQHRIMLRYGTEEFLAPAKAFLNSPGVRTMKGCRSIAYHTILLPQHEVIFAEGAAVESFFPGPGALSLLSQRQRLEVIARVPQLLIDPENGYGSLARPPKRMRAASEMLASLAV